jgi:hypothetical protein
MQAVCQDWWRRDQLRMSAMHISDDTPDRLTLESRPWILGSVLIGFILLMSMVALFNLRAEPWLAFGMFLGVCLLGVAFVAFVRRVIVIFDRKAGAVVIRTASLMGQSERTLPLDDIAGVAVETSISRSTGSNGRSGSVSRTHRPVLETRAGPVPLTEVYSGGNGAAKIAEAVNRWLGIPQP